MKSKNTFGVHFTLRLSREVGGKFPIYVRVVVNKTRVELALKCFLLKEDWNGIKGLPKPKNDDLKQLTSYLEEVRAKIINHYRELEMDDQELTAEAVKNAYLGIKEPKKQYSLLWLMEEHNTIMEKILKPGSLKNYYTTARYLKVFLKKKYNLDDIHLGDLRFEFITAFEYFIRSNSLKKNDPCTNNGTMKHLERLKKIVSWAVKNEWIEKNPFIGFQLKFKRKDRDFLNGREMSSIESADLSNPMLQTVRDLFIFSCYTGLSYIDLVALKPQQLLANIDGIKWIKTSRAKTDISVNVPLLDPAIVIMEKFISDEGSKVRETVFPRITNQEMNRSLKVIAGICGIRKDLTFHLARHTFATTVTLMNGVPIESISKMLGHSKLSTTMIYARVTQTKIGMDMELLQNRLNDSKGKSKLIAVK
jgi:site-specific recombinase XerD